MNTTTTIRVLALLGAMAISAQAAAIPITIEPADIGVAVGGSFTVDIVISELNGEIVSAFDLDVLYDPGVILAADVFFSPLLGLKSMFEVFSDFDLSLPGIVDAAQLSLLSDAELLGLQDGASMTLFTILFDTVGVGQSPLSTVVDTFNDVKGLGGQILPVTTVPSIVAVVSIDEPPAIWLIAAGLLPLIWRRPRVTRRL